MRVEVWSDIVCPFCYIGKRRLEGALAGFEHRDQVEVVWRSFQLDPASPRVFDGSATVLLAAKYGMSLAQAQAAQDRVSEQAAGVGLTYRMDRTRPGNTLDAHRLVQAAAEHGLADAAHERFMRAYFTEGAAIGDRDTLAGLAVEVGLPAQRVREVLDGTEYVDAVRRDQQQAHAYGASGVPFFVFSDAVGVSGAQPPEVFAEALRRGWSAAHPDPVDLVGDPGSATCADDNRTT